MKSIISAILLLTCTVATAQIGENEDAIGVQFGGSLLLFNECCYESLIHSDPQLEMGYRVGVISRHSSGDRFYHDFQLTYSGEKIGYTKERQGVVESQYLEYEAYHFIYYFGYRIKNDLPLTAFIGHNFGHIMHNRGDQVESELFGLNFKLEYSFALNKYFSIEPVIDYSWTYNKTTSYNNRIVFGVNVMRKI